MRHITEILKTINVGEKVIYRGHANDAWALIPSIGRHYDGKWADVLKYELKSLEDFKKRAIPYLKHEPKEDIEWLCLMQHHGLSTRLLDFTTNPLIALFFASDFSIDSDGELIVANYSRTYQKANDESLFKRTQNFAYHPPHITERIIGQHGCFVFSSVPNTPLNKDQISKIKIKKEFKVDIRDELNTLGINYSSLFPGIDGICKDINESLIYEIDLPF
ncbi:MAG: FRG domain-containing protein [Methylophilus sp.]